MAGRGKIVVTGASGLVGRALVPALRDNGFEVLRLVRRTAAAQDEARWDPDAGTIDTEPRKCLSAEVPVGAKWRVSGN